MATTIMMKNPKTGILKKGFYGFSWTTLFFPGIASFFRGDIKTGVFVILACLLTGGIAGIVWAFMYNKWYTRKLVEQGYEFMGTPQQNELAKERLGIADISPVA